MQYNRFHASAKVDFKDSKSRIHFKWKLNQTTFWQPVSNLKKTSKIMRVYVLV